MNTTANQLGRIGRLTGRDILASLALAAIGLALAPVLGLAVLLVG